VGAQAAASGVNTGAVDFTLAGRLPTSSRCFDRYATLVSPNEQTRSLTLRGDPGRTFTFATSRPPCVNLIVFFVLGGELSRIESQPETRPDVVAGQRRISPFAASHPSE